VGAQAEQSRWLSYREAIALLGVPLSLRLTRYMRNGQIIVNRADVDRLLREHERRAHEPRLFPKGERRQSR
jgi:hypothetical protein